MRAFVAVDLPEELRAELRSRQRSLHKAARGTRWVRPEGIHLTLKFLGEVPDERVDEISKTLASLPPFTPFKLQVKGIGFFPQARRPRVLWVGIEPCPPLEALAAQVNKSLEAIGFAGEQRAFQHHLTLARFRVPRPQPEIEKAKIIVAAFENAKNKGLGVVSIGSKMIDLPVVKRAQKTIELALLNNMIPVALKE